MLQGNCRTACYEYKIPFDVMPFDRTEDYLLCPQLWKGCTGMQGHWAFTA